MVSAIEITRLKLPPLTRLLALWILAKGGEVGPVSTDEIAHEIHTQHTKILRASAQLVEAGILQMHRESRFSAATYTLIGGDK